MKQFTINSIIVRLVAVALGLTLGCGAVSMARDGPLGLLLCLFLLAAVLCLCESGYRPNAPAEEREIYRFTNQAFEEASWGRQDFSSRSSH